MKNCRKITLQEMRNKFPDLMIALDNPKKSKYCWGMCDGIRIFRKNKCTICSWSSK